MAWWGASIAAAAPVVVKDSVRGALTRVLEWVDAARFPYVPALLVWPFRGRWHFRTALIVSGLYVGGNVFMAYTFFAGRVYIDPASEESLLAYMWRWITDPRVSSRVITVGVLVAGCLLSVIVTGRTLRWVRPTSPIVRRLVVAVIAVLLNIPIAELIHLGLVYFFDGLFGSGGYSRLMLALVAYAAVLPGVVLGSVVFGLSLLSVPFRIAQLLLTTILDGRTRPTTSSLT